MAGTAQWQRRPASPLPMGVPPVDASSVHIPHQPLAELVGRKELDLLKEILCQAREEDAKWVGKYDQGG